MNYQVSLSAGAIARLNGIFALLRKEGLYAARTSVARLREHGSVVLSRAGSLYIDADERELWAVTVSGDGEVLFQRGDLSEGAMEFALELGNLTPDEIHIVEPVQALQ